MDSPYPPVLEEVITASYSVVIVWRIPSIVSDQENYIVQYGTDMMLLSSSNVVLGNDDTNAINDLFSINITGLTPFTRYYYVITATNTIGSTNTSVMSFTTNEAGMCIDYSQVHNISEAICVHSSQYSSYGVNVCCHNI